MTKIIHTRLSSVIKKKYDLPTSKKVTISYNSSNDGSNIICNSDNSVITLVCKTQTQVVEATQDIEGYLATSEALIEEVADLDGKTANDLDKTPVTEVTVGGNSSREEPIITTTLPSSSKKKRRDDSCEMNLPKI